MKVTEISKVLGEMWGKMDAGEKAPYNERAQADKERYVFDGGICVGVCPSTSVEQSIHCAGGGIRTRSKFFILVNCGRWFVSYSLPQVQAREERI